MSEDPYVWRVQGELPRIQPHSLAKHRVLSEYLERYVAVLTANVKRRELRLTLVDGFSGGGVYLNAVTNQPHSGSPLIMLEAMAAAEFKARSVRTREFKLDVKYIFIEKNPEASEFLQQHIENSRYAHR